MEYKLGIQKKTRGNGNENMEKNAKSLVDSESNKRRDNEKNES